MYISFCQKLISIHAAREGGDFQQREGFVGLCEISIHAAREGGDLDKNVKGFVSGISIHAAREGGDVARSGKSNKSPYFNPRRP